MSVSRNINFLSLFSLLAFGSTNAQNFVNQLWIPDTLHGPIYNLDLDERQHQFYSGFNTQTYGYSGTVLGPTLIMNAGEFIQLNVTNNLTDTTTTHWHGMHVAPHDDGGPHTAIPPNTTWSPDFTVLDKATTFWYHPHLHGTTNRHVSRGASGLIIVKDAEEASRALPRSYGIDDIPLIIQTKAFNANRQIRTAGADTALMVNGVIRPQTEVPAQFMRFRMLNGSSNRVYMLGLSDNRNFWQIGSDGGLLEFPVQLNRLMLSPGERAEIVVNFTGEQGEEHFLMSFGSELLPGIPGSGPPNPNNILDGVDYAILKFNVVTANGNPVNFNPAARLTTINPFNLADVDVTRTLTFNGGGGAPFTIDNTLYDHHVNNQIVRLGDIEIWELQNQTPAAHPFHIHDIQFIVLDKNGSPPPANQQGLKDVILVEPFMTVRFITQFTDFADEHIPYMYHCHILPHEDAGMMGQFIVVDECCREVTQIDASVTGSRSVDLSWSDLGADFDYEIRGRSLGSSSWVTLNQNAAQGNSRTVNNVPPNRTFEWQVRGLCVSGDTCNWSALDTFSTACVEPQNLSTSSILPNRARLNWQIESSAMSYLIRGRQVGGSGWTEITVNDPLQNRLNTGPILSPGTSYEWQIQSWCDQNGSFKSTWSDLETFTTPIGPPPPKRNEARSIHEQFRLFPNPTRDYIYIDLKGTDAQFSNQFYLYDMKGALQRAFVVAGAEVHRIDVSDIEPGCYLLKGEFDKTVFQRVMIL